MLHSASTVHLPATAQSGTLPPAMLISVPAPVPAAQQQQQQQPALSAAGQPCMLAQAHTPGPDELSHRSTSSLVGGSNQSLVSAAPLPALTLPVVALITGLTIPYNLCVGYSDLHGTYYTYMCNRVDLC
jgi:hypothetical protein